MRTRRTVLKAVVPLVVSACTPGAQGRADETTPPPLDTSGGSGVAPAAVRFGGTGYTPFGEWRTDVVVSAGRWVPGIPLRVDATLTIREAHLAQLAAAVKAKIDGFVALVTAERTFDADGILRLPSDERMSTLLTVTSIGIEGGTQGAVSKRVGYAFGTPVDELATVPLAAATNTAEGHDAAFSISTRLAKELPPGIYRLRIDYGVAIGKRVVNLSGEPFAKRGFPKGRDVESEIYSPPIPASGPHTSGRMVDATAIRPRVPWVLLAAYNSNGYRGVVADEDAPHFALSSRNIMQDDVILPRFADHAGKVVAAYSLEPAFPADAICARQNIPWEPAKGELSVRITQPDGTTVDLGSAPFVARTPLGLTTKNAKFTQWKPPAYGRYTVRATGWTQDAWGNHYEGGGTYSFWIAKRMTLATATFQGQAYPVGNRYGRDMAFSPAVPAHVDVTATLFANSDPAQARTVSYSGTASAGGMFTANEGLKPLVFDAPGEYQAKVLATYTDRDGHLWASTMRHAGIVYPADTPIVARGKKLKVKDQLVTRGETHAEGWIDTKTEETHLEHVNFPYQAGDVLLIAAEYQGANKIEPVLTWDDRRAPFTYDPAWQAIGITNVRIQTSNGYSPHLFPEYITDLLYYYGAAPRPGFMGRFLVGEDGVRAPYWPTTNTNFGGQINASSNGDAPGHIYRLIGGVVVRRHGETPLYAGYMATAFILPKGSKNNRVIAPGSEDLVGSTRERARIFLAMNARPGILYETGTTFAPAFQIDPMLPVNMRFTMRYPDGRSVSASGVADAGGSWVGGERWPLDVPGLYRYSVDAQWSGHKGLVPGMPQDGGAIYVVEKERPAGAPGITFALPPQSTFDAVKGATFTASTTAREVHYAMITPGAVLAQGMIPVQNGKFSFLFDAASLNERAQTYEVVNQVTGKPELGQVVHLTFFSKETSPTTYHSFVRLIIRGNTVLYTR
ncbi:MAG TPA: hypothetical protein VFV20_04215 [Candidatus Limnocylindria bacterium]|nr:hypothetical protein [Candidatus Limnocylindria bacterium]